MSAEAGRARFRLYVDESGNHDMDPEQRNASERYLSLTGVAFDYGYARTSLTPDLDELKMRHFNSHPDDPVVLHRRDIIDKRGHFRTLRDPTACARFDRDALALLRNLDYFAITVVIDKWDHQTRYRVWATHPYHYCMEVLAERYVLELRARQAVGDVMAESRGGTEDRQLRSAFTAVYDAGTPNLSPRVFANRLTSRELKLKPKKANVAGLQVADLLAHPAAAAVRAKQSKRAIPPGFGGTVAAILEEHKWRRRSDGKVEGWGTKWLP